LRYCIEEVESPKYIVFEVSGTITLNDKIIVGAFTGTEAETHGSYITIAGQTAPSPGITIKNYGIMIERNCHDILIQHLRIRPGDDSLWDNYGDSWNNEGGTVYSHVCTDSETDVFKVVYNNTTLTEDDGDGASVGNNEWDLDDDNDLLYVNVGADPADGELVVGFCKECGADALTIDGHYQVGPPAWAPPYNIVVDHCSFSWSTDMNVQTAGKTWSFINNITSEALHNSYHEKGQHSKGMLVSEDYGDQGDIQSVNVAVVGNLFAHNDDRNPRMAGAEGVVVNNLVFDCRFGPQTGDDDAVTLGTAKISIVGNYIDETDVTTSSPYIVAGRSTATRIFLGTDNFFSGSVQTTPWDVEATTAIDLRTSGGDATDPPEINRAATAAAANWPSSFSSLTAAQARAKVLATAGARPADRDTVDARIISEVTAASNTSAFVETIAGADADCTGNGEPWGCCTGDGTGDCPDQTWPTLAENYRALELPTDKDVVQASGYTNMEEWLHDYHYDVTARTQITGAGTTTITGAGSTTIGE
jgi:pectate lyase